MVCLQWQAMRQTQRPTETQISIHLHRIQFTVSVQYEHLHTILYNPFFIRLWIGLSVEQCEHTIKCRCFPGYLKLLFRFQLEAIWTSHSKSRFVGLVFNWKQLEVFSFNEPNLPVVHQIRLVKFYAEILILLPMFSVVSSSFVWQPRSI